MRVNDPFEDVSEPVPSPIYSSPDPPAELSQSSHLLYTQLQASQSLKFKLIHDFTLKLREEEQNRLNLLAKINELEEICRNLDTKILQNRPKSRENEDEMRFLRMENEKLKKELKERIDAFANVRNSEIRRETDNFQTEISILQSELTKKDQKIAILRENFSDFEAENRKLQGNIEKLEREMSEIVQNMRDIKGKNSDLRRETARLTVENETLAGKMREEKPNYAVLEEKLEETTERIRNLEEMLMQTSVNYEELRQQTSSQGEMKGEKRRNRSKSEKKRKKSGGNRRNSGNGSAKEGNRRGK